MSKCSLEPKEPSLIQQTTTRSPYPFPYVVLEFLSHFTGLCVSSLVDSSEPFWSGQKKSKRIYLFDKYHVPGMFLSTLPVLTHLILLTTL